jgi:outer membrane protein assembly factor BamB
VSHEFWVFNDSYAAVSDGVAYFATLDGDIAAVCVQTGEMLWTLESKLFVRGAVASGLNVWNGRLYYTDIVGSLCCVDIQTRRMIYQTKIYDRVFAPMLIDGGRIYIGGRTKNLCCIDAETGECLWSSYAHDPKSWFSGGCVTMGNAVYAGTSYGHAVAAFDKDTGEFLRLYPADADIYTAPVRHGGNFIVAATCVNQLNSCNIMEFDTKRHVKLWQAVIGDAVLSPPAIHRDVLYFGSNSGVIYSIDLTQ